MAAQDHQVIPTPVARRFRAWRHRALPIVVWGICVYGLFILANQRPTHISAVGVVEERVANVAPLTDGSVQSISVDLFDSVEEGQVVAMMDDTALRASVVTAEAELARLRSELRRVQAETARTQLDDGRRFAADVEDARLDYLDRLVALESNRIWYERERVTAERQARMVAEGILDESVHERTLLEAQALKKEIDEMEPLVAQAAKRVDETEQRSQAWNEQIGEAQTDDLLAPLTAAARVQEALIHELALQREGLLLQAPSAGTIAAIYHRAGETVLAGTPLLSISEPGGHRVVAYVPEVYIGEIGSASDVELRTRRTNEYVLHGKVIRNNTRVEMVPEHLRRNPFVNEWGVPVLVGHLPENSLFPGEVVDLRLAAE